MLPWIELVDNSVVPFVHTDYLLLQLQYSIYVIHKEGKIGAYICLNPSKLLSRTSSFVELKLKGLGTRPETKTKKKGPKSLNTISKTTYIFSKDLNRTISDILNPIQVPKERFTAMIHKNNSGKIMNIYAKTIDL